MSELTPCNYCTLASIRQRAKARDMVVTLLPERGGFDVFMHPPEIHPSMTFGVAVDAPPEYWRAWFMALTDHCVC